MATRPKTHAIATAASVLAQIALSACITVQQPAADDESLAAHDADASAMDDTVKGKRGARDLGVDAGMPQDEEPNDAGSSDDPEPEDDEMDEPSDTRRDASAQNDDDPGESRDASELSEAESHHYCGIMRVTTRICNGTQSTDYGETCEQDVDDCLALLPPDERIDYDEYCYTRTEHHVFGDERQVGTCEQFYGYWNDDLECLLDSHCGTNEKCIDNACACPDGAECVCPYCGPVLGTCDGDVLHEQIAGGPCDENRQCVYEDEYTDCAASGLVCDPNVGQCVEPSEPPPPPAPGGPGSGGSPSQ